MSARTDSAVIARFENDTGVPVEVIQGDLRTSRADLILIGRDPELISHFCHNGNRREWSSVPKFQGWHAALPSQPWIESPSGRQNILRIPFRPRASSRGDREFQRGRLQLLLPLAMLCSHLPVLEVACCPISCRMPEMTAAWMVQEIWEFTTICKLGHDTWKPRMIPRKISIFCRSDVTPLLNAFRSHETHGRVEHLAMSAIWNEYLLGRLKLWNGGSRYPYMDASDGFHRALGFRFRETLRT